MTVSRAPRVGDDRRVTSMAGEVAALAAWREAGVQAPEVVAIGDAEYTYRRIVGAPPLDPEGPAGRDVLHALGRIHGCEAAAQGLGQQDLRAIARGHTKRALESYLPELRDGPSWLQPQVARWTDTLLATTRALTQQPPLPRVPIHGRLKPEHVLAVGGRVTGLVDWETACVGQRLYDVAYVVTRLHLDLVAEPPEREAYDAALHVYLETAPQLVEEELRAWPAVRDWYAAWRELTRFHEAGGRAPLPSPLLEACPPLWVEALAATRVVFHGTDLHGCAAIRQEGFQTRVGKAQFSVDPAYVVRRYCCRRDGELGALLLIDTAGFTLRPGLGARLWALDDGRLVGGLSKWANLHLALLPPDGSAPERPAEEAWAEAEARFVRKQDRRYGTAFAQRLALHDVEGPPGVSWTLPSAALAGALSPTSTLTEALERQDAAAVAAALERPETWVWGGPPGPSGLAEQLIRGVTLGREVTSARRAAAGLAIVRGWRLTKLDSPGGHHRLRWPSPAAVEASAEAHGWMTRAPAASPPPRSSAASSSPPSVTRARRRS